MFRYLGRPRDQTDDDWPAVRRNIMLGRSFWGRLRKLLRQEGTQPMVLAIFFSEVVQAILLYGLDMWVLLEIMERNVEGIHTGFLCQTTGKPVRRLRYGTQETPGEEGVQEAAGTQLAGIYIDSRQATLAQWVALHPLSEVCTRDTGYEGGGKRREA